MEQLKDIQVKQWQVDTAHSKIGFTAKHLVVAKVHGQFDSYKVNINSTGDNFEDNQVTVEIDAKSINTGVTDRDNHLKSADFFNVDKYPTITFRSTSMKKIDDETFKLYGDFTINGITKPLELDVEYGGQVIDPWGNDRIGFHLAGTINRFDYNLTWNALIETGGAVVGKNIKIDIDLEIISQPDNH